MQKVHEPRIVAIQETDLTGRENPEQALQQYQDELMTLVLDDNSVAHLQVHICQMADNRRTLILHMSGLIADRSSLNTLLTQLAGVVSDNEAMQYADIAEWFYEVQLGNPENSLFWARLSADKTIDNPLMGLKKHRADNSASYQTVTTPLSDGLLARAKLVATDLNVSIETLLTSVWYADIAKTAGKDAFVLWHTVSMRAHQELVTAQGAYAKQLPLIIEPVKAQSWIQLCQLIGGAISQATTRQEQFDLSTLPATLNCGVALEQQPVAVIGGNSHVELSLSAVNEQGISINFDGAVYTKALVKCIGWRFNHLLRQLVEQPQQAVNEAILVSKAEKAYLQQDLGINEAADVEQTLVQQLVELASEQADAIAIQYGQTSITYGDFVQSVNHTAGWLKQHGVQAGDRVAVYANAQPELLYTWFAIMSLGASYITLEPGMEFRRQQYILEDGGVKSWSPLGRSLTSR